MCIRDRYTLVLRVLAVWEYSWPNKNCPYNSNNICAVHNPKILPMRAVSSEITASTSSICSIEPRSTRSSGSINVRAQNPKYCEYTRSTRNTWPWNTVSEILSVGARSVCSIAGRKHLRCSSQYTSYQILGGYWEYWEYTMVYLVLRALTAKQVMPI